MTTELSNPEKEFFDNLFDISIEENLFNPEFKGQEAKAVARNALRQVMEERENEGEVFDSFEKKKEAMVEALKRTLIGSSAADSVIIPYGKLPDPEEQMIPEPVREVPMPQGPTIEMPVATMPNEQDIEPNLLDKIPYGQPEKGNPIAERRKELLRERILRTGELTGIPAALEMIMETIEREVKEKGYNIDITNTDLLAKIIETLEGRGIRRVADAEERTKEYLASVAAASNQETWLGKMAEEEEKYVTGEIGRAIKAGDNTTKRMKTPVPRRIWEDNNQFMEELKEKYNVGIDEQERANKEYGFGNTGIDFRDPRLFERFVNEVKSMKNTTTEDRARKAAEAHLKFFFGAQTSALAAVRTSEKKKPQSKWKKYATIAAAGLVGILGGTIFTKTRDSETKLRNAESQIAKQEKDISKLANQYQILEEEKDETIVERDKVQGDLDQKTKDYTEAVAQNDEVKGNLENISKEYNKLEQNLTNTKDELEKSTEEYKNLNSKYLELVSKKDELETKKDKIEKDLADARKGYDTSSLDAQKKLEEKEVEYKTLEEKLAVSETTVETVRKELIETSQKYGELQKAYKKATSQQTIPTTFVTVKDPTTKPDETPKIEPTTDLEKKYSPIEQLLRNCDGNSQYQRAVEAAMKQSQTERKDIQKKIEKLEDIERRLNE